MTFKKFINLDNKLIYGCIDKTVKSFDIEGAVGRKNIDSPNSLEHTTYSKPAYLSINEIISCTDSKLVFESLWENGGNRNNDYKKHI